MKILEIIRKKIKISQSEIANKIGVSVPTYRLFEKGSKKPNQLQLQKLSEILGVNLFSFFEIHESDSHESYVSADLPSALGHFDVLVWPGKQGKETVVIKTKNLDTTQPVLVRVHSECLTGDIFNSYRCDCGPQKNESLKRISKSRNGMLIYLRQEGRGIGLFDKIKAYKLQEKGYDTHEANIILGHDPDYRDYAWVKKVCDDLDVQKIKLLTNNPSKISQITQLGIDVVERIPLVMSENEHNKKYFETKRDKFKHFFGEKEDSYFYQCSYIRHAHEVEELGKFLENKQKDPLLKICLGVSADSHILRDPVEVARVQEIFKATELFSGFVPILHFTFKKTTNALIDLKYIHEKLPFVKYIQLNDIQSDYFEILQYANKFFLVDFPLHKDNYFLVEDERFIKEILDRKTFILLDNSHGKGKKERKINYITKINTLIEKGVNNIALYGGFGPKNLELYFELCNYYKINFSVDAETQLKTEGQLDGEKAKEYFSELIDQKATM